MSARFLLLVAIIALIIVVSLLYELLMKQLLRLCKRFGIPRIFLSAVTKELALLGLISFLLFLIESSNFLDEETNELVHKAHFALFLTSISYISLVAIMLTLSIGWSFRFSQLESSVLSSIGASELPRSSTGFVASIFSTVGDKTVVSFEEYSAIRSLCVKMHALPDDVPFHRYLRKCLQHTVLHATEIDAKLWMAVIVLVLVGGSVNFVFSRYTPVVLQCGDGSVLF
eukprot:TRINITY_DN16493_c0_g1_i1.p1 TRINITY_DN16493_c0_g1~~TRINITY_DN16493_c0_g1_i1.p1  ORF type:complete len:228 (+),score=60.18 TRINITY_DN16493_c0_g1_i1:223-906(+)